jgi:hypothetical protein
VITDAVMGLVGGAATVAKMGLEIFGKSVVKGIEDTEKVAVDVSEVSTEVATVTDLQLTGESASLVVNGAEDSARLESDGFELFDTTSSASELSVKIDRSGSSVVAKISSALSKVIFTYLAVDIVVETYKLVASSIHYDKQNGETVMSVDTENSKTEFKGLLQISHINNDDCIFFDGVNNNDVRMIYHNNLYGDYTLLHTSPDVDDPDVPTVVISNLMIQGDKTNVYTKDQCDEKFMLKNTSGGDAVTDEMDELWLKKLYFGTHSNTDWSFVNTYDNSNDENTLSLMHGGVNAITFTREDGGRTVKFDANVQFHLEGGDD